MIDKLYRGKDGVIRAVGLRTSKSYIEHLIQYLYPLELHCDGEKQSKECPPRHTAAIAEIRMEDINDDESNNGRQQQ